MEGEMREEGLGLCCGALTMGIGATVLKNQLRRGGVLRGNTSSIEMPGIMTILIAV